MESKTIKENKNLSLNRTEYILNVKSGKNPSKADVVALLKSDAELTVVRQIDGSFGKDTFTVDAVVYNTPADKTRVETIPRKVRKKAVAEAKKAAADARAAAGAK
jgi:ribosomal protein S24E